MGTYGHDFDWVQATLRRTWEYLNAAEQVSGEDVGHNLQRACQACDGLESFLPRLSLTAPQRAQIQQEIFQVKSRLKSALVG